MKFTFLFISSLLVLNLALAGDDVVVCKKVIKDYQPDEVFGPLEQVKVSIIKSAEGIYELDEDLEERVGGDGLSIIAFSAGCHGFGTCKETKDEIKMNKSYTGGDSEKATAVYNKNNKTLRARFLNHKWFIPATEMDVTLQCE